LIDRTFDALSERPMNNTLDRFDLKTATTKKCPQKASLNGAGIN
jgi:hypothetical protein